MCKVSRGLSINIYICAAVELCAWLPVIFFLSAALSKGTVSTVSTAGAASFFNPAKLCVCVDVVLTAPGRGGSDIHA